VLEHEECVCPLALLRCLAGPEGGDSGCCQPKMQSRPVSTPMRRKTLPWVFRSDSLQAQSNLNSGTVPLPVRLAGTHEMSEAIRSRGPQPRGEGQPGHSFPRPINPYILCQVIPLAEAFPATPRRVQSVAANGDGGALCGSQASPKWQVLSGLSTTLTWRAISP
jgi:hypothetical protein